MAATPMIALEARERASFEFSVRPWRGGNPVPLVETAVRSRLARGDDEYSADAETQFTVRTDGGIAVLSLPADHSNRPGKYWFAVDHVDGATVTPLLAGTLVIEEGLL